MIAWEGCGVPATGLSTPHIWPPAESPCEYDPYAEWQNKVSEAGKIPKWIVWGRKERLRQAPKLNLYLGGNYIHWHHPPTTGKRPLCDRGPVLGFSAGARLRLLRRMNKIDRGQVPANSVWMVTLTYPGRWTDDAARWKRDLQVWRKRLMRTWGPMACFWKLEAQQRGAPHFHLLLFTPSNLHRGMRVIGYRDHNGRQVPKWKGEAFHGFRTWCANAWASVVGSEDPAHVLAGTSVEPTMSMRGALAYSGKYLGKESLFTDKVTGEVLPVGRFWGIWNDDLLPMAKCLSISLNWEHWHQVRRWVRRAINRPEQPALYGVTRSMGLFISASTVRRMVEHVAGEDTYERGWDADTGKAWAIPGTFWEAIHRIKRRAQANEEAPPTPAEQAALHATECQPYLNWSDDDEQGRIYLN